MSFNLNPDRVHTIPEIVRYDGDHLINVSEIWKRQRPRHSSKFKRNTQETKRNIKRCFLPSYLNCESEFNKRDCKVCSLFHEKTEEML